MKNIMIETSRLILREFVPEDLAGLYCLYEESDTQFLEAIFIIFMDFTALVSGRSA